MKCHWKNDCPTPNRCCHFCKKKDCWQRCKDEHKGCDYFIDEKDEESSTTVLDVMSDKAYYQMFKNKEINRNG